MRFSWLAIVGIIFTASIGLMPAVAQTETDSDSEYTAQTTKDPLVPEDELALMVKPLTLQELEVEADAWQALVRQKVRQLSTAEIAVKRKNKEIEAAKDTAEAVEDVQAAMEKSDEDTAEATQRAQEAAQRVSEARARVEEDDEVREAVADAAEQAAEEAAEEAADEAPEAEVPAELSESDLQDAEQLAATAETAKQAADATAAEKENLLDRVNRLRDERTELVDRTRIVLDSLDFKGADTAERRNYLKAVSGVDMDTSDWAALRATVLGWFTSEQGGLRWAGNIGSFIALLAGFWIFAIFVGRIADRGLKSRYTRNLTTLMRDFISTVVRRAIIVVGFVVALTTLEIDTGPLLAAIGAAGFVIAFALQDSLSNFASGIMILMYRPFDVGDVVDTGGASGTVTSLNLVSVTINTFDNKKVIVPNNKVWNDVIVNATGVRQRRVDLVFGIGYQDDIAKTQEILERLVKGHELVLKDPEPVVRLHELGDSSVNFICRPWVKTSDYWTVYWDITRAVKEAFDTEGISIPFPQRDVHIYHANAENANDA